MPARRSAASFETSSLHLLHRAGQCADEVFASEMTETGLTARQLAVLRAIKGHRDASQTTIVDLTGIDRSTMADLVRRLIRKGLVRRTRDKEDNRAYALRLTEQGERILAAALPASERADKRVLEVLPTDRREQFLRNLSVIVAKIGQLASSTDRKR